MAEEDDAEPDQETFQSWELLRSERSSRGRIGGRQPEAAEDSSVWIRMSGRET